MAEQTQRNVSNLVFHAGGGTKRIFIENEDLDTPKITLTRDLDTVPITVELNPTEVRAGGFSSAWDRISRVQTAFSAVELPDNANELKINNSLFIDNNAGTTNLILDKGDNNIPYPFSNPDSEFETRLSKLADRNLELGILNNNINIVKNVIPTNNINDLTLSTTTIIEDPQIFLSNRGVFSYGTFLNISRFIWAQTDFNGIKTINIQDYTTPTTTLTFDMNTLTIPVNYPTFSSWGICGIYPLTYTSPTECKFAIVLSRNETANDIIACFCDGDPTLTTSYTFSTNWALSSNILSQLLFPTVPSGTPINLGALADGSFLCPWSTMLAFYDDLNDYYIWLGCQGNVPSANIFVVSNRELTQACSITPTPVASLSSGFPLFLCVNPELMTFARILTDGLINTGYLQNVYWDKVNKILYESQLFDITNLLPNYSSVARNNNQECFMFIENGYLYSCFLYPTEVVADTEYLTNIGMCRVNMTNMHLNTPELVWIRPLETVFSTLSNINAWYYSINCKSSDIVQIFSSYSNTMFLSNDGLLNIRSITNVIPFSYLGATSAESESTIFLPNIPTLLSSVRPTHIIGFGITGGNRLESVILIDIITPTANPTQLGSIDFTNNNMAITSNNQLQLNGTKILLNDPTDITGNLTFTNSSSKIKQPTSIFSSNNILNRSIITSTGQSSQPTLDIRDDSDSGRALMLLPNAGAGIYNPIVSANSTTITTNNIAVNNDFILTTQSASTCGIVIKQNEIITGCGGNSGTPTDQIDINGSTGTIDIKGSNGVNMNSVNGNITVVSNNQTNKINMGTNGSNIPFIVSDGALIVEGATDLTLNTNVVNGNINLNGGNIVSGSSGSNSGQHLRLIINGTPYKIQLFNDV